MIPSTPLAVLGGATLGALVAAGFAYQDAREAAAPVNVQPLVSELTDAVTPLVEARQPAPGKKLGSFRLTYYWMPSEKGHRARHVQLYTRSCHKLARVSKRFSHKLELEGGGRLRDGRVLVFSGACSCSKAPCYKVARQSHRWGTGADGRALSPFRSVAVDPSHVAVGSLLYVPELDGLVMPGVPPWGGFVHDGCVVADDRGAGIKGHQIDLFAAQRAHYHALQARHHLHKITVYDGSQRCHDLRRRMAHPRVATASRGQI